MSFNHSTRKLAALAAALGLCVACGGTNPTAVKPSSTPLASPSLPPLTGDPVQQVLAYRACPKDGKQTVASVLSEAAKAPDLKIEQSSIVGEGQDMIRVGVLYDYNAGAAKHQVIFELHPSKHTVTGEDTISKSALDLLKVPCK